tara:strand:- start:111 stop:410 length:300 start_codon:yes stop_codon:yes gene_type:complete
MVNPLSTIIEQALDSHPDLAGNHANAVVAAKLANELTIASWEQLASVTGAQLETDYSGQLVLYTGSYIAQSDHEIIHAREPTDEEEAAEASANIPSNNF